MIGICRWVFMTEEQRLFLSPKSENNRKVKTIMKHEYKNFRATGVAFSPEENENHEAPNRSLSSSKVMGDGRGDKNAYRGYWVGKNGLARGYETFRATLLWALT